MALMMKRVPEQAEMICSGCIYNGEVKETESGIFEDKCPRYENGQLQCVLTINFIFVNGGDNVE